MTDLCALELGISCFLSIVVVSARMAFHPLSAKSWLLTIYMGNRSDKGLDKWQANLVTTSSVLLIFLVYLLSCQRQGNHFNAE